MPKIVDHEARRTQLVEALWRVLAREGPKGVTVRKVSAEAGWSRDAVDHYFDGKQELLACAMNLAVERTLAQVRGCCKRLRGREALRAVLLEALALEGSGPEPAEAWLELIALAARDPALAAELARFDSEVSVLLTEVIAEMVRRGEAPEGTDAGAEARALVTFNLGLHTRARLEPERYPDEVIAEEVDGYLDRMGRGAGPAR